MAYHQKKKNRFAAGLKAQPWRSAEGFEQILRKYCSYKFAKRSIISLALQSMQARKRKSL